MDTQILLEKRILINYRANAQKRPFAHYFKMELARFKHHRDLGITCGKEEEDLIYCEADFSTHVQDSTKIVKPKDLHDPATMEIGERALQLQIVETILEFSDDPTVTTLAARSVKTH